MPGRGVVGEHRVQVACRDAHEEARRSHALDRLDVFPVGLCDDAHAQAHVLEHPPDHRRAERGMIDIRITGNDEYIQFRPPLGGHLRTSHGQETVVGNRVTARLAWSDSHVPIIRANLRPNGNQ